MKHVNRSAPKIGSLLWSTCDLANRKCHILSTKRGIKEISGERILGSAPKIHLEETDRVVKRTGTIVNVSGGDNLLNRVVDALGNPIDENEALSSEQKFRVGIKAPGTNPRVSVCDVSAYIPTNVIPITNGQIFLLTGLLYKGIRPGINVAAQRRFYSTSGKPNDENSPLTRVANFKTLLEKEIYVDKTNFLGRIMRYEYDSIVILRPPGFGKSIMSSMMKYFFECGPNGTDNSMKIHEEFKAYNVMTHDCPGNKKARSLAGKSYVLYYDFRNVNEKLLQQTISAAYSEGHQMAIKLLDGNHEVQTHAMNFTINELKTKCDNIIVIIDEFDTPLNAALARLQVSSRIESKREEAEELMGEYIAFLGSLYGAATHLILFGRLVVNYNALVRHNTRLLLRLNTLIQPGEFHQDFGFTQEEIEKFPCELENIEKLKKQFGGYGRDGTLFNSRSFYEKCFTKMEEFPTPLGATAILPFFVNNDIILKTLIQLVNDQQIKCQLKHLPLYRDITESYYTLEEAMAVFCVLGLVTTTQNPEHDNLFSFRITNEECKRTIQERIISTETLKYTKEFERMSELVLAIQNRDWDLFNEVFGRYILNFPFARIHMQEAVVHCTLGGVLYHMQHSVECREWVVQSDNSAGHGRYDHIWFSTNPKDTHAIIFEYGRDLHGNPEAVVTKKYNQIMKMKYQEAFFPYKHINMYDIVVIIFAPNGRTCTTKFYRNIPYTRHT